MLPNLAQLALVDTGGFYELTDAELQQIEANDVNDPITYDRPTHTMTFRVQNAVPNPDGTPRYMYYSPAVLWDWVRQPSSNGRLPGIEGQTILYEDWWTLHMNYDPSGPVPAWVRGELEKQAPFRARMAQAEQRIRDRLRREAEERAREAEREEQQRQLAALGPQEIERLLNNFGDPISQNPNGAVVLRWRFWLKGPIANLKEFPGTIKRHFADLYKDMQFELSGFRTYAFEPGVADGRNLAVWITHSNLIFHGGHRLNGVTFAVMFSRRAGARAFLAWTTSVIERYGFTDFVRRAHKVNHAFGGPEYQCEADLPRMVELGTPALDVQAPNSPSVTVAQWDAQPKMAMVVGYHRSFPERTGSRVGLDTAYPVPPWRYVRWCFWLKGRMDNDQIKRAKKDNKRFFAEYMMRNAPTLIANMQRRPWNQVKVNVENVKLAEEGYRPVDQQGRQWYYGREAPAGPGIQPREYPAIRCKFLLELREPYANEFVAWFTQEMVNAHDGDLSRMYRAMVQLGPSKIKDVENLPTVRDSDYSQDNPGNPIMTEEVYNAWGSWTTGVN